MTKASTFDPLEKNRVNREVKLLACMPKFIGIC